MSQYTSQLGSDFIGGLLSAQKFKQFQSDLQTSAIQRQLVEQQLQHQSVMQPLLMAHEKAVTAQEGLRNQGLTIANNLANMTFADKLSESSSAAKTAKVGADTAEATKGAMIEKTKADTELAKTHALKAGFDALSSVGATAGAGDQVFTPEDINNLLDSFGVPKEAATRSVMGKVVANQIGEAQTKDKENRAKIDTYTQANLAQAEARRGIAIDRIIKGGSALSDLASQNPEGYQAAREFLRGEFGDTAVTIADMAVASARRKTTAGATGETTTTSDPGMAEYQKKLGDNLSVLLGQLQTAKREHKESVNRDTGTFEFESTHKKEIKAKQDKVDDLTDQIKEVKAELQPVVKKVDKGGTADVGAKLSSLEAQRVNVAQAKDEDLPSILKYLNDKGITVDLPTLKALRERQRGRK